MLNIKITTIQVLKPDTNKNSVQNIQDLSGIYSKEKRNTYEFAAG